MRLFGFDISRAATGNAGIGHNGGPSLDVGREERGAAPAFITQNATAPQLLSFLGQDGVTLPAVTTRAALRVPAVLAATMFLSRTMATLTFEAFRTTKRGPEKVGGRLQTIVRDAPNPEWSKWRAHQYFWQQHFLQGRGLFAILRQNGQPS